MKQTIFAVMILVLLAACGPVGVVPTPNPDAPKDDAFVATACAMLYPSIPGDARLNGVIALDDYKNTSHLYLLNLENHNENPLATLKDTVSDIVVSPDGKNVGYQLGHSETGSWNLDYRCAWQSESRLDLGKWILRPGELGQQ